ncbi:MAG: response regulator, partial [Candidatus Brocadia sp.]
MKKILIVDDDTAMGEMCKELLKSKGYPSDFVTSGREAIERATTNGTYTIILTDLVMPDIDGIEVLKKVKQQNSNIEVDSSTWSLVRAANKNLQIQNATNNVI